MFGRAQGINFGSVPKLLAPEISFGGNFMYDAKGQFYSTTTIYGYIKNETIKTSYETLQAIMNSTLCWWFLKNTGTILANGYFRYKPSYLNPFPFPEISENDDLVINSLVKSLIWERDITHKKDIEATINNCVYKLYGLNDADIKIIER